MVDVCAGIVTFNPNIELLKQNIISIIHQVNCIVIFDNGSDNIIDIRKMIETYESVYILNESENRGIAYALNQLCKWADKAGLEWILTLDQDSISPQGLVESLCKYISEEVAIVSPNILYKNNENYKIRSSVKSENVEWTITSASLTSIKVWREIGGFDEWLFIDGVDYDYGVRANNKGYKVIRTYETELLHELGNLKCIRILGNTIFVTNHSALRKYYMSRNTIYLYHKLKRGHPYITILKYVLKTVFFEKDKMKKLSSIKRGIGDGLKAF